MRLFAIALLALPAACAMGGGSTALVVAQQATVATVAPSVAATVSIKAVCDGAYIFKLLKPDYASSWLTVIDTACEKDPQSFAGAGVDLLEAAVMLKLDL